MGHSQGLPSSMVIRRNWVKVLLPATFIILSWLFLWQFPWQDRIQSNTWLRLGIALTVFIAPGVSVYGLIARHNAFGIDHLTFGFVISHLLVAFVGLIGRFFHFSFDLLINIVMASGGILLLFYLLPMFSRGFSFRISPITTEQLVIAISLTILFVLVGLFVIQRDITDDDLTYLAYLTNSQSSTHLYFKDVMFGLDQLTSPRFWLMSAPLGQAFLAELSKIPGIVLLVGYYQPFLVAISMMCWYGLARTLGLSQKSSALAVVLQVLFLLLLSEYIHPGSPFFYQLDADKVTASFIISPLFLQSEILLLRQRTWSHFILCLLTGLSLTLMHPIALAYSVFIGGVLFLLQFDRKNPAASIPALLVIAIILMPQVILRFVGSQADASVPYGLDAILSQNGIENMITRIPGTQFYGFNLHSLEMRFPYGLESSFLHWVWLVIPLGAMIFAVQKLRQREISQYIFSAFVLCALVGIPFTGWIIGYFLSAWALERALWLFPFGVSTVFLLQSVRDHTAFGQYIPGWMHGSRTKINFSNLLLPFITVITSIMLLLFMREQNLPDLKQFESKTRRYADIAGVGRYLDRHIQQPAIVMGSEALNDLMPGVSSKAKLITFRTGDFFNMSFFPVAEIEQRIADRKTIFSETAPPELKLELLRKYDVRFIVLTGADRGLFAGLLETYPSLMTMEKVERFFVIEIKDE